MIPPSSRHGPAAMSASTLLVPSALLLLSPWALKSRTHPRPEIHGPLLRGLWWINAFYCGLVHRLDAPRLAPLPAKGAALLISNHTCGVDNLILQAASRRVLGFLIAREWFDFWACRPFCRILDCIPVRRDGRDLGAARAALRALESGRVVPIFPEGTIVPTSGREFGEGKKGAAFLAMHAKVPVIPSYIRGTPETENVFKALLSPSNARVVFGDPIDPAELAGDPSDRAELARVTDLLMNAIKALRDRDHASS